MLTFIKIAWRNITRNRRRSSITISAVGFGIGALIFIWSFVEGAHRQMIENYTSLLTSHIQIHQKGFHQKQKLEMRLDQPQLIFSQLKQLPSIKGMASRIKAVGLVSSAESSSGVLILGVDPLQETTVSTLNRRVKTGQFLKEGDNQGIIIGKDLALNLNVSLEDKIILMSQAMDGSIASGAYRVKGIMDTGVEEVDKGLVLITLAAAQELFVMPEQVSEIALRVESADQAPDVATRIMAQISSGDLEILPWQELSASFQQWIEFDNAFIWMIVIVVMIVVAIGILNTILMGVLERTREFGILLSIGTNRQGIIAMVAWESFFLGILGSIVGLCLGAALTVYFGKTGIDLSIFTSALSSFYMDPVIYPRLQTTHMVTSLILVLATSIAASIYPAWHAANLKPIKAMRSM